MWGGRFAEGPSARDARDKCLDRLRQAALAAGHRREPRSTSPCSPPTASSRQEDADAIEEGLDRIEDEYETQRRRRGCRARGHPHACRAPPRRIDRPGGGAAAHRALAQRPGGDRLPALGARRDRRGRSGPRRAPAAPWSLAPKSISTTIMPGFTHLQIGPAGDPRPSSHGLLRDASPRPLPLRRRARPAKRMPAWARRLWPAPAFRSTARRPRWRSASTGRPPIRSTRSRTGISRSII